jgi:hypothetical protein
MNGRGLNGTSGGAKRKRARAAKRPKAPTNAQQAARAKIIAESGVTPSKEGMEAILQELRLS